jgi:hypothetical protein
MEDMTNAELVQLINFYRQKSSELEFQVLQLQIKLNKAVAGEPVPAKKTTVEKTK